MISSAMILVRGLITAATSISLLSNKIIGRNVIMGATKVKNNIEANVLLLEKRR